MKQKPEFKAGDIVTFQAYSENPQIKAKVLEVKIGGYMFDFGLDGYKLEGISHPLNSRTTGKSIVESEHFKLVNSADAFKD